MSAKAISEQTGKEFLYKYICTSTPVQNKFRLANVTGETDFDRLVQEHPWLLTELKVFIKEEDEEDEEDGSTERFSAVELIKKSH